MKECRTCKQSKPLDEFYNRTRKRDGKHADCKTCFMKHRKTYMQTDTYRKLKRGYTRRFNKESPEKKKALNAVHYAIKMGRLVKQPCEKCEFPKVQAHHEWGYEGENALKVMWLCLIHHRLQHKEMQSS
jgi:hypothetical protein